MFRKLVVTLGAAAALGAVALSPTAASAKHWHHHWHGWYGGYYPIYVGGSDCYTVKRVYFVHGIKRVHYVQVCD
jgi:hypothetical protein